LIPIVKVRLSEEEIEAAVEVLRSGRLVQGKKVEGFERVFAEKVGAKYAVAVSSGTAALHISYLALLEPSNEVLVPSFTHISTASMVHFAGGKPIFCDIDPRTFTLDVNSAKEKLTSKTRIIAPVHLFGNACDIDKIIEFARNNNLKIVWDACQALGTKYKGKDVGSFDDLVCYSFYPTKNMTTGEGGMITTNIQELAERCRLLRSHGQEKKYFHTSLGLNYRMTEIEAAIGLEQLKKLDKFIKKRRANARYLNEHLSQFQGITIPFTHDYVEHSFHQYCILIDLNYFRFSRDELIESLRQKGIEVAVHYPRPVHKQPIFSSDNLSLPISEEISKRILSLPVHPWLKERELASIVKAVKASIINDQ